LKLQTGGGASGNAKKRTETTSRDRNIRITQKRESKPGDEVRKDFLREDFMSELTEEEKRGGHKVKGRWDWNGN